MIPNGRSRWVAAGAVVGIVGITGLFRNLPQPALAAVVITASLSLADTSRARYGCPESVSVRLYTGGWGAGMSRGGTVSAAAWPGPVRSAAGWSAGH